MAHAQKPDFVFRPNEPIHLNRRGRQFSRLLAAEVCASAVVTLDTPRSEVECKTTGYPLHSHVSPSLPLPASPCAITFQLSSTAGEDTEDNMVHAHCLLDMSGYRHALRIRNAVPFFCTNNGCTNRP